MSKVRDRAKNALRVFLQILLSAFVVILGGAVFVGVMLVMVNYPIIPACGIIGGMFLWMVAIVYDLLFGTPPPYY